MSTNLLIDGDMEAVGTSAWTVIGSGALSKDVTDPYEDSRCMLVERDGGDFPGMRQEILTAGYIYRVQGAYKCSAGASAYVGVSPNPGGLLGYSTSWTTFDITPGPYENGYAEFWGYVADPAYWVRFDALSVELVGRNLLLDGWMERSDTSRWQVGNSATLTKETGTPYQGARCMRCAYNGVSYPAFRQDNRVTVGRTYRVRGYARGDGSKNPCIFDDGWGTLWTGTSSTDWQEFDLVYIAQATTNGLKFASEASSAGYTEWDKLELYDLSDPHYYHNLLAAMR